MTNTLTTTDIAVDPAEVAERWLRDLSAAIVGGAAGQLQALIRADGWWRDQLILSWDLRTTRGSEAIANLVVTRAPEVGLSDFAVEAADVVPSPEGSELVQIIVTFATAVGTGRGVVRLTQDDDGAWRAWTVLTSLKELTGYEERNGSRRPQGNPHGRSGPSWLETRNADRQFSDRDPEVLIVGGGQGGLALAARLVQVGVDALVVDTQPRVGDAWRNRYRSLSLHDPVWYNHMPYLNFPDTWPVYMPKDKIADWLEYYAEAMEINIWTSTKLVSGHYDDATKLWTAVVRREDGTEREFRTPHLVMATGMNGRPRVPEFLGQSEFRGKIMHSSEYTGEDEVEDRRVVVVGAATSGHDICQDLVSRGAEATMVQRTTTYVMSTEHGIPTLMGDLYKEGGPPVEYADLIAQSFPHDLTAQFHVGLTEQIRQADEKLLTGLEAAGFRLDYGDDGSGIAMKVLRTASGYYIDVGCSELIVSGAVKVAQGAGVAGYDADGVILSDGRHLDADIVVLATGYDTMREQVRELLGSAEADRASEAWGLDAEGEVIGAWRPTGHPGLWYMLGNLSFGRYYSEYLALQLLARLRGIAPTA